ncbi:hypothetical protein GCM10022408_35200 [Hymenobacter fastidiosus]|uniref:Uncharacterized protein n=1 Tax=Hymenobacter fastidiosus TaxID=486264 RepID=A0ABP7SYI8_9BACT
MKKLNVPCGIVFDLLSLVNLVSGAWLTASINGLLAAGFLLSDIAYAPAGAAAADLPPPIWRRYSSIALAGAALLLFGYQISRDSSARR